MRRRIAAVLMADAAGMSRALAENEPAARARLAEHRAIIFDIVGTGGGRCLASAEAPVVAVFQSAVQAMRTAVEIQETLRARNRALGLAERLEHKLAVTIGEVVEGADEIPAETLASATRLVSLAAPGGICISRSVREAVANKLAVKLQDLTVEGEAADLASASTSRATAGSAPPPAGRVLMLPDWVRLPRATLTGIVGVGIGAAAVVLAVENWRPSSPVPQRAPPVEITRAATPAPSLAPPAPETKAPPGGKLEFLPSKAPDPAAVLTARRMLPNAWRECQGANAEAAVAACKTLLDSGLPKEAELAEVQYRSGKALHALHRLDEAMEMLTASIATRPGAPAFAERGTVHYEKRAFDKAIADYTEAIRRDATQGEAFNNRAWTYYQAGRADKALPDADTAVRLLAGEAYVWDTRAHIHAKLGNREAAIRDFRAALKIDPASAASKAGLASLGVN